MTMKFRQRIAWIAIVAYLSITCALTYYIFEIHEKYTKYAFDHSSKFHLDPKLGRKVGVAKNTIMETSSPETSMLYRIFSHLTDIPLLIWIILFMIPYFQVFFLLLACTKPDPRLSFALLWPSILYLKWRNHWTDTISTKPTINGDCNSNVSNNCVVLDT